MIPNDSTRFFPVIFKSANWLQSSYALSHTRTQIHTCTHTRARAHTHAHTHMHTHARTHIHTHTYTHTHIQTHTISTDAGNSLLAVAQHTLTRVKMANDLYEIRYYISSIPYAFHPHVLNPFVCISCTSCSRSLSVAYVYIQPIHKFHPEPP